MATQEQIAVLENKLNEMEVAKSTAEIERDRAVNDCEQLQRIMDRDGRQREGLSSTIDELRIEIRQLRQRISLGYEYTQDVLQNREG